MQTKISDKEKTTSDRTGEELWVFTCELLELLGVRNFTFDFTQDMRDQCGQTDVNEGIIELKRSDYYHEDGKPVKVLLPPPEKKEEM